MVSAHLYPFLLTSVLLSIPATQSCMGEPTRVVETERRNLVVWEKAVEGGRLLLERAYVYGGKQQYGHYQHSVILARAGEGDAGETRELLWLRRGSETATSPLPSPTMEMLDAQWSKGQLLVLFNQYRRCWAFRIQLTDDGWTAVPDERIMEQGGVGFVSLGAAMKSGTVAVEGDDLVVHCTTPDGDNREYRLATKDATPRWQMTAR